MDGGDDDGGAGAATAPSPRAQLPVSRACPVHPFPLAARGGTWAPARRARLPRLAHALGCAARAIPHAHPSRPHPLGLLLAQFLLCGGLHGRGRSPHRRLGRRPCLHRQLRHRGAGGAAGLLPAPACASRCPLTCLLSASSGTTTTTSSVPTSCPLTRIAASSGYARTHNARGPLPTCVASEGQHG